MIRRPTPALFLGIEGGASRTTAVLMDAKGHILKRTEGGPSNLRLTKNTEILRLWKQFQKELSTSKFSQPTAVGAFLAGCRTHVDKAHVRRLLQAVWPHARYVVGNDTMSAFAAALGENDGIVLICGTGSIVRARRGETTVQIGGRGHVGGDRGSGYWMGRELLRSIFCSHDEKSAIDPLTQSVLAFLGLNKLEELVQWSLEAAKDEVASLTRVLFRYVRHPACRHILQEAVEILAADVALAAWKVGFPSSDTSSLINVALNPGLAKYQPLFRRRLIEAIQQKIPETHIFLSETEGAVGAAMLAASAARVPSSEFKVKFYVPQSAIRIVHPQPFPSSDGTAESTHSGSGSAFHSAIDSNDAR